MNSQAFKILEFDPLRALVRRHAQTGTGLALIDALAPIDDYRQLSRELRAVGEMIEAAEAAGGPVERRKGATAVEVVAAITTTLGGLRIDGSARAAPGVFAAGADAGGISTGGYSSGLAAALVFGRIAAETALR